MLFSDQILSDNSKILDEMLTHKFVEDICTDALPKKVFDNYLIYEGAFVETAISIFAYCVARAPDIFCQRKLISVLEALANSQIPYFEDRLKARSIQLPKFIPIRVAEFKDGMLEIAKKGDFIDIITAMFAAEWMYWTWCKSAATCHISDPDVKAWIDLHVEDEFANQALWLKSVIDEYCTKDDLPRLNEIFSRVMALEIRFHDAAYENPTNK